MKKNIVKESLNNPVNLEKLNTGIVNDQHKITYGNIGNQFCYMNKSTETEIDSSGQPIGPAVVVATPITRIQSAPDIMCSPCRTHQGDNLCLDNNCNGGYCNPDGSCHCPLNYYGDNCDSQEICDNLLYANNLRNTLSDPASKCDCSKVNSADYGFLGYVTGNSNPNHGSVCERSDDDLCNGFKPVFGTTDEYRSNVPDLYFKDAEILSELDCNDKDQASCGTDPSCRWNNRCESIELSNIITNINI